MKNTIFNIQDPWYGRTSIVSPWVILTPRVTSPLHPFYPTLPHPTAYSSARFSTQPTPDDILDIPSIISNLPPYVNNPTTVQFVTDKLVLINHNLKLSTSANQDVKSIQAIVNTNLLDIFNVILPQSFRTLPENMVINNVTYNDFKDIIISSLLNLGLDDIPDWVEPNSKNLFSYLFTVYNYPLTPKADLSKIEQLLNTDLAKLINDVPTSGIHRVKRQEKKIVYSPHRRAGIVQRDITDLIEVYGLLSKNIMKVNRDNIHDNFTAIYDRIITAMNEYTIASTQALFSSFVIKVPRINDNNPDFNTSFNDFIYNMNIQNTQKMINLIAQFDTSNFTSQRRDSTSIGNPLHDNIRYIINTRLLKSDQKQYLIENYVLSFEFNYFQSLFTDPSPKLELTVFRRFYTQLVTGITIIKEYYSKNNYKVLKKIIDEPKGRFALFFMLCDSEMMVGVVFSEMVKLIHKSGFTYKSTLCNHVADVVFRKATQMKIYPTIDSALLQLYPDYASKGLKEFELDATYKINLGIELVENTLFRLDAFSTNTVTDNGITQTEITFTDKYRNILAQIGMDTMKLPMIHKPDVWSKSQVGGYLTPEMKYLVNDKASVIHNSPYNKFGSVAYDLQYESVNYLNSQRFVINKPVLECLLVEWNKPTSYLFKGHNLLHPLDMSKADKKSLEYKKAITHNSKYYHYKTTLDLAIMFSGSPFYLPVFLDYRGRIYPEPTYLSYQGSDLIRGLIKFAVKYPLVDDTLYYLKVYLANVFGLSSKTFQVRLEWFDTHYTKLATDYYDNNPEFMNFVSKAKEPFQFYSAFVEILGIEESRIKATNFPILFDCSCSGIQHISALCGDVTVAKMVNVLPDKGKSDIYTLACDYLINKIATSTEPKIVKYRPDLSRIVINRSLMKIPVMTIPYNITLDGISDKIIETIVSKVEWILKKPYYTIDPKYITDDQPLVLDAVEFGLLSYLIYSSLYDIAPIIKPLIKYLTSMVRFLDKIDAPIFWVTPALMHISGTHAEYANKKTKSSLSGVAKPITLTLPTGKTDTKKNARGFVANLIHSLDASHINLIINRINNTHEDCMPLYTIHDCYATTPNFMGELNRIVLSTFVEQYFDSNYIKMLERNLLEQLDSLPLDIDWDELIVTHPETGEDIAIPQIPTIILQNWEANKSIFIEGIKNSSYLIS